MNDDVDSPIPMSPTGHDSGNGLRGNGDENRTGVPLWDQIASEQVAPPPKQAAASQERAEVAAARAPLPGEREQEPRPVKARRDRVAEPRPVKAPRDRVAEPRPVKAPRDRVAEPRAVKATRGRVAEPKPAKTPRPPRRRRLPDPPENEAGRRFGLRRFGSAGGRGGNGGGNGDGEGTPPFGVDPERQPKPKVRKLRLFAILGSLGVLGVISFVFGVLMSVASDIPLIENSKQFQHQANSYLFDDHGHLIGVLDPPTHNVIVGYNGISKWMRRAVVAVEDKRFWSEPGVDIHGVLRAVVSDVAGSATQGASTIAEQFVKNALSEQGNRTVFEKLREAALAFHLSHRWNKTKILTEYLNSIYFGNGAYGVESAARAYFGKQLGYDPNASADGTTGGCGNKANSYCAANLDPAQAALLAGMIASPGQFNPLANPASAKARRKVVLGDMLNQGNITREQYDKALSESLPTSADIEQPQEPPAAPYFTSWVEPQIIKALEKRGMSSSAAHYRAYYGGLKIKTTLDLSLQRAADQAIEQVLPYGQSDPAASLVAIDNHTGEVRAMVGGPIVNGQEDYQHYPFNLATQGHRQPGSAFKPFTLAVALRDGISPYSTWVSAPQDFIVPNSGGKEHFIVHNFGNQYSGLTTLQNATDYSDNSVFSQVGIKVGTRNVAIMAKRMGIRSRVSPNYAMILGAMKEGPTLLDMAHAYETFATGGVRVWNPTLGSDQEGPIGIHSIGNFVNHPKYDRVLAPDIAHEVQTMLEGPVQSGTATEAAIPGVIVSGKTGTTSNYGDAWFVGWTPQMTVAVWVGFPNKLIPMSTLYNGQPVEGGTYPAIIWRTFMEQALQILAQEAAASKNGQTTTTTTPSLTTGVTAAPTSTVGPTSTTQTTTPATTTPATGGNTTAPTHTTAPAPAPTTTPTPTPTPTGNTGGGTGNTGGTGGTSGGTTGGTGLGGGGTTGP